MPSGGARAKSGPAPARDSARTDNLGRSFRVLTGESRRDALAPRFPLPRVRIEESVDGELVENESASERRNRRESELWAWAWTLPQSEVWAEQSWFSYLVAQWVRLSVLCETEAAKAADKSTMLRLADQIGLTPAGLAFNRWAIGPVEQPAPVASQRSRVSSSRDRMGLKVVSGGGA